MQVVVAHSGPVSCMHLDGDMLWTGGGDKVVHGWRLQNSMIVSKNAAIVKDEEESEDSKENKASSAVSSSKSFPWPPPQSGQKSNTIDIDKLQTKVQGTQWC